MKNKQNGIYDRKKWWRSDKLDWELTTAILFRHFFFMQWCCFWFTTAWLCVVWMGVGKGFCCGGKGDWKHKKKTQERTLSLSKVATLWVRVLLNFFFLNFILKWQHQKQITHKHKKKYNGTEIRLNNKIRWQEKKSLCSGLHWQNQASTPLLDFYWRRMKCCLLLTKGWMRKWNVLFFFVFFKDKA